MRTHQQIIADAGGYRGLATKLTEAGHTVEAERVRFWELRQGIPAEMWPQVAEAGVASLEELVAAFAAKKQGAAA